jgi:selenocysteine lyase/cysteine desulfurase
VAASGCDAFLTSPYKWYGPHAGVLWLHPEVRDSIRPYKVRPAPETGPGRFETGTAAFETIAGVAAAARFLTETRVAAVAAREAATFGPLLTGLRDLPLVTLHGPPDPADRTPTVCFSVAGHHPDAVAAALADRRIAVWSGDYYAVETMDALGLDAGAVRAGVSVYTSERDVERLLEAVATLAR